MPRRTVQAISKYQDYEVDVLDINGRTYTYTIRKVQTTSHAVKKALKMHGPTATWAGNVRGYQALQETPTTRRTARERAPDAEAAGEEYAMEQLGAPEGHGLGGTFFMDWVHEQMLEASRMDPSTVLPLETKSDARVIAGNMLQQLVWDTKRDLDGRDIARLIGIDIVEREDISAFFEGFEKVTDASRDWLADELLEINRELLGRSVEASRSGRLPQRRLRATSTHEYEVVVGNSGVVLRTDDFEEAQRTYDEYVDLAHRRVGRVSREPVTLLRDGEPIREWDPGPWGGRDPDLDEARRSAPARSRGLPAPRRREGIRHRYVAISQDDYADALEGLVGGDNILSWEGPFTREEYAREFIENEYGVPAMVVDLGADGAREWERVEAGRQAWLIATRAGQDVGDWGDQEDAAMAALLRRGTVLGRHDTQRWEGEPE